MSEKLILSLLSEKSKLLCDRFASCKHSILNFVFEKISRLFSGKEIINIQDQPRWMIYSLEDIGNKTGWWTIEWILKINKGKTVQIEEDDIYGNYAQYITKQAMQKRGNATFKVNLQLRRYLNKKSLRRENLVEIYVYQQLQALFPKKTYMIKNLTKLIASFIY